MFSGDFSEGDPTAIADEAEDVLQRETFEADSDLEGDNEDSDYDMSSVATSSDGDDQSLDADSGVEEIVTTAAVANPPPGPTASTATPALTQTEQDDPSTPQTTLHDSALTTSLGQNLVSNIPATALATSSEIAPTQQAETAAPAQEIQAEDAVMVKPAEAVSGDAPKRIIVRDFAKRTYESLLWYLHSGVISFAPLHSQYLHDGSWDWDDYRRDFWHTLNSEDRPSVEHGLLPSSPKSLFRLADSWSARIKQ